MKNSIALALGLSIVITAVSPAQGGRDYVGWFGLGTGSGTIMCSACEHAGNMGGSTLSLQLAAGVSKHVRLGSSLDTWWHSRDSWERGVWNLNALALYYPWTVRRGFFVGGGPTYSLIWAVLPGDSGLQRHGWGVTAEMGYDIVPRSKTSLTPFVEYSYAWVGDISYPVGSGIPWARGWRHQVVSVGLGVTFHESKRNE
jgi:hypothetical protein